MVRPPLKNLTIGYGLYMASWWVSYPLAFAYGRLTDRIIYPGNLAGAVLMPLVLVVPYALVAVAVGACFAWLIDSERPVRWAIFPAALYFYFRITGYQCAHQPTVLDRVTQIMNATFMGIACIGGAILFVRRLNTRRGPE